MIGRSPLYNDIKKYIQDTEQDRMTEASLKEYFAKAKTKEDKENLVRDIVDGDLLASLMDDKTNHKDIKKAEMLIGEIFTWIKASGDDPNLRKIFLKAVDVDSALHKTIKGLGYTKLADSITGVDKDNKAVDMNALTNAELDVLFNTMPQPFAKEFVKQQALIPSTNEKQTGDEYKQLKNMIEDTSLKELEGTKIKTLLDKATTQDKKEKLIDDIINGNLFAQLLDSSGSKDDIEKAELLIKTVFAWVKDNNLRKIFIDKIDQDSDFHKTLKGLGTEYSKIADAVTKSSNLTDTEMDVLFNMDAEKFITELKKTYKIK